MNPHANLFIVPDCGHSKALENTFEQWWQYSSKGFEGSQEKVLQRARWQCRLRWDGCWKICCGHVFTLSRPMNDEHVFTDRCVGTIASNVFTVQWTGETIAKLCFECQMHWCKGGLSRINAFHTFQCVCCIAFYTFQSVRSTGEGVFLYSRSDRFNKVF